MVIKGETSIFNLSHSLEINVRNQFDLEVTIPENEYFNLGKLKLTAVSLNLNIRFNRNAAFRFLTSED